MIKKDIVVKLTVDHREAKSGLIDELINYSYETEKEVISTKVEIGALPVGDVICSDRVAVERKSVSDFVSTFVDAHRELFTQSMDMLRAYPKSVMILEGDSIFGLRNIHPEALRASVCGLTVGMRVPIVPTKNVAQTAAYVVTMAKREQFQHKRSVSVHGKRSQMSRKQRQIYVVSSIGDGVGVVVAEALLEHFGSVQAVFNAPVEELVKVNGVGKKIAEKIRAIIGGDYK